MKQTQINELKVLDKMFGYDVEYDFTNGKVLSIYDRQEAEYCEGVNTIDEWIAFYVNVFKNKMHYGDEKAIKVYQEIIDRLTGKEK